MTDNNFHLAAALLADAADLVAVAPLGTTIIDGHAYGPLPLTATHTIDHHGAHTLTLWTADDYSLLAAVEAHQPADTATPTTHIVAFRAAHQIFTAHQPWTFTAASEHTYTLAAHIGDDHWDLTIDGHHAHQLDTIDDAVDELLQHHNSPTAR